MTRDRKLRARSFAWLIVLITSIAPATRGTPPNQTPLIGLSLIFQNSVMAPITLVGDAPRYVQEIDVVANTPPSNQDLGIAPLINNSEFSALDWRGVQMVDEDWRTPDGVTFTRQRFYRGAGWMEKESQFKVFPVDANGVPLGEPLIASAGSDDRWKSEDDGFVRRFTVQVGFLSSISDQQHPIND